MKLPADADRISGDRARLLTFAARIWIRKNGVSGRVYSLCALIEYDVIGGSPWPPTTFFHCGDISLRCSCHFRYVWSR